MVDVFVALTMRRKEFFVMSHYGGHHER